MLLGLGLLVALGYHAYRLRAFYARPARAAAASGAGPTATTEVVVLGTVHFPTAAFTADSLYNALETLRPDVILFEIDSVRIDQVFQSPPLGQRLAVALGLQAESNEIMAVAKYKQFHPVVLVRPYEWDQRDAFHRRHHILTTPDSIFTKLRALRAAGRLTSQQQRTLGTYDSLTTCLNDLGATQPLSAFNSVAADSLAQRRQYYQYHKIKAIVDATAELREFRNFYRLNERYWDIRNLAMARNIRRYAAYYPGRRLLVLTGFFHRYYLRRELAARQGAEHYHLVELDELSASAR